MGWLVGTAAGCVLAAVTGEPVAGVLGESIGSPFGIAIAIAVALLTTCWWWRASRFAREQVRVGVPDVIAAVAVLVVAVALLGGVAGEERLATSDSAGLILLLLPGLLALAAAIAAARLFPPLARLAAGRGRLPPGWRPPGSVARPARWWRRLPSSRWRFRWRCSPRATARHLRGASASRPPSGSRST